MQSWFEVPFESLRFVPRQVHVLDIDDHSMAGYEICSFLLNYVYPLFRIIYQFLSLWQQLILLTQRNSELH